VETRLPDGTSRTMIAGLRTSAGVSEAVGAGQVLGSIIMFGLLYALLFVLWVWVLNHKIQQGPAPAAAGPEGTRIGDLLAAAAQLTGHERSLTDDRPEGAAPSTGSAGRG
jgi:cytochrome d ubiquinol oxidase subunit I